MVEDLFAVALLAITALSPFLGDSLQASGSGSFNPARPRLSRGTRDLGFALTGQITGNG